MSGATGGCMYLCADVMQDENDNITRKSQCGAEVDGHLEKYESKCRCSWVGYER